MGPLYVELVWAPTYNWLPGPPTLQHLPPPHVFRDESKKYLKVEMLGKILDDCNVR